MSLQGWLTAVLSSFNVLQTFNGSSNVHNNNLNPENFTLSIGNCLDYLDPVIMSATNVDNIRAELEMKCGANVTTAEGAGSLYRAFAINNQVAFNVMLDVGVDAFKQCNLYYTKMSAYQFISTVQQKSTVQQQMFARLETMRGSLTGKRRNDIDAILGTGIDVELKYWARLVDWNGLAQLAMNKNIANFDKNYKLSDGSTLFHQAVIGNNLVLLENLLETSATNDEVNTVWTAPSGGASSSFEDIKEYCGINPIGWTPLMLAVSLNRKELVTRLLSVEGINRFIVAAGEFDVKVLARLLPLKFRFDMLKQMKFRIADPSYEHCAAFTTYKDAIRSRPEDDKCLQYHSWNFGVANDAAAVAAVSYLSPTRMKSVLSEWDPINKHIQNGKKLWNALKMSGNSSIEDLKQKLVILTSDYGLHLDDVFQFQPRKTPWQEILEEGTTEGISDNLIRAVLKNTEQFDVNKLSGNASHPFVVAMEHNNSRVIKLLLETRAETKIKVMGFFNERNQENLMHHAIVKMTDDDKLLDVAKALLTINKTFLDEPSFHASINCTQYKVAEMGDACVHYAIHRRSNWTPLMYAIALRRDQLADYLITAGADKNHVGVDNITAKSIADLRWATFLQYFERWKQDHIQSTVNQIKLNANRQSITKMVELVKADLVAQLKY